MSKDKVMSIIQMYIMSRIINFYDVDELTEVYAQRLENIAAYATAEEMLGKDAPEEDKKYFIEHMIEQRQHKHAIKEFKKTLKECYGNFRKEDK